MNKTSRNSNKEYHYLKKVTSDVCGPISPKTYSRHYYFMTFLDKATRFLEIKLLYTKDKAYKAFLKFKSRAKNNLNNFKVRIFATNNGGKYVNKRF